MKIFVLSTLLLLSISTLSIAEPDSDVYQVTYTDQQSDLFLVICIFDECQKTQGNKKSQDKYIYDFGTFPISTMEALDLKVWKLNQDKRRIKRAPDYVPDICNIKSCGSFNFDKVNVAITSTKDKCKVGLAMCHKAGNR